MALTRTCSELSPGMWSWGRPVGRRLSRVHSLSPSADRVRLYSATGCRNQDVAVIPCASAARLIAGAAEVEVVFSARSLPARIVNSGNPYPDDLMTSAADVNQQSGSFYCCRFSQN